MDGVGQTRKLFTRPVVLGHHHALLAHSCVEVGDSLAVNGARATLPRRVTGWNCAHLLRFGLWIAGVRNKYFIAQAASAEPLQRWWTHAAVPQVTCQLGQPLRQQKGGEVVIVVGVAPHELNRYPARRASVQVV